MDSDSLKRFLVHLPARSEYKENYLLKHSINKVLYYCITNEGDSLNKLFPSISEDELNDFKTNGYNFDLKRGTNIIRPFYLNKNSNKNYSHPPDKACARAFKMGEPVYNCEDCGFDETCVICSYCFNEQDHINHNVSTYTSHGNNGGICDCGDPEAFINKLNCKCQMKKTVETDDDFSDILNSLYKTMKVVIDYILDVTNFSLLTLPFIHAHVNKDLIALNSKSISNYSALPSGHYGGAIDLNSDDEWYLLLWNDEFHNLQQAVNSIRAGSGVDEGKANEIANRIDKDGFCILKKADKFEKLLEFKRLVEQDGLVATIISARDYMKEAIVRNLISWLNDILNFNQNSQIRNAAQSYFAELMLEPDFQLSKVFPAEFISGIASNEKKTYFENGVPYEGQIVNLNYHSLQEPVDKLNLLRPVTTLFESVKYDKLANSRLQYFLLFQIRLSKKIRKQLKLFFVSPFVTDLNTKNIFAKQFIEIYPNLLTIKALTDREEDLNLLRDITSQLFTCPLTIKNVLSNDQIGYIIAPIIDIIENFSSVWVNDFKIYVEESHNHEQIAIRKAISIGIHNLVNFMSLNFTGGKVANFFKPQNFTFLVLLLKCFQGFWPVVRKLGDHVEREILDFKIHLSISIPLLSSIRALSTSQSNNAGVDKAINLLLKLLLNRKWPKLEDGVLDFKVSAEPIGFINPLSSLLSFLLQNRGIENYTDFLEAYKAEFINISDISLRSIVLGSQAKTGLWVRNGLSISHQATLYFGSTMAEYTFFRDFHINQIGILFEDSTTAFKNMLTRWEIQSWYANEVKHEDTIYEEKFPSIIERFVTFIYNMVSDRSFFIHHSTEERAIRKAKLSMAYVLADKARSYTILKQKLDVDSIEISNFDDILYEIADYQPPSALVDTGLYRLKDSWYDQLDAINLFLDPNKFQTVSEALIKNKAKTKKIKEDNVVLIPHISLCDNEFVNKNIGNFVKTKHFIKLIYKLLQVAIDTSDETFLPHLLHLIHLIILDDELIHGEKYLNENFVSIPVSDLLLTIVESKMSKFVIQKADYLVDQFVKKDERIIECLIDCFGEEYVATYKKRKVNLFETETERKRRQAEERKNKILKKFSKQREKFITQNKDLHDEVADKKDEVKSTKFRTCVLCGEEENHDKPFGIMVSTTKPPIFWKVPDTPNDVTRVAFKNWDKDSIINSGNTYGIGYDTEKSQYEISKNIFEYNVLSTCGHTIHYDCFIRGAEGLRHYPCPLCHNLHDLFIPSFICASENKLDEQFTYDEPKNIKYNQIVQSNNIKDKMNHLNQNLLSDEYFSDREVYLDFMQVLYTPFHVLKTKEYLKVADGHEKAFNSFMNWTVALANTIRMNEIATRVNGREAYVNFLDQIPGAAKTLIISMIQARSLMPEYKSTSLINDDPLDLKDEVKKYWDSDDLLDSIFSEVVNLFFLTDESLATLTRLGMIKLICVSICSLIERFEEVDVSYFGYIDIKVDVSKDKKDLIEQIIHRYGYSLPYYDDLLAKTYICVEKLLMIYLRQIVIFQDCLTCQSLGDNTYESSKEIQTLKLDLESGNLVNALTKALKIPSYEKVLYHIIERTPNVLETNIFEIVQYSKIAKYQSNGILALDYPGIIHLVNLPSDYHSCILCCPQASRDHSICLLCSKWVQNKHFLDHMSKCSSNMAILFNPKANLLKTIVYIGSNPITIDIPAPYLTKHGEVKTQRYKGKATLNEFRYHYLNKLWLNQGLYGFVTRNLFGSNPAFGGVGIGGLNINLDRTNDIFDIDEDDEDFMWEDMDDDDVLFMPN
ncbi:unnamed protein product [Candida verbasci]|uniref:E3 ubiquitin-protein ligase n=1 Tax=Candida verbasci TaxID=1227364 RepID=A0A9W4TVV1_9ASCO|nr:unnamed protein product [Candida verbasci]